MTRVEEANLGDAQVTTLRNMDIEDLMAKLHLMRDKEREQEAEQEEREYRLRLKLRNIGLADDLSNANPLMEDFAMKPSIENFISHAKQ